MLGTSDVVGMLREEEFKVDIGYLNYLLRDMPILRPKERVGSAYVWGEPDVFRLKSELRRRGRGPEGGAR